MNISEQPKAPLWRAEKGGKYAYITITHSGNIQINKSYEYAHAENDRHYEMGNYFRVSEVTRFSDIIKILFKDRV